MQLRLHNSRTRRVEDFAPADPLRTTIYLCGPTVYNYVHIGNARGPVVFGVLVRLLRHVYGAAHVVYARNVTDVDDKINAAAAESGVAIDVITRRYAAAYDEDMARLGVDAPDIVPYATAHIPQIITMCETLIAHGHAYAAQGHVLFDVSSYADYGQLSGRSTDEMIAGARIDVAPYKKNPADFVLWKPSTPDLPGWDSPWGRGRPGWHIECSAMSAAHLGETIDIHAGGNDLLFPHHENEVAQSTCAHAGKLFARFWLHNGMLTFDGKKMSKSLGNTLQLHELLQQHPPELLRYMLVKAHYRQPLDWSDTRWNRRGAHSTDFTEPCATWPMWRPIRARCRTRCSPRSPTTSTRPRRWRCSRDSRTRHANPQIHKTRKRQKRRCSAPASSSACCKSIRKPGSRAPRTASMSRGSKTCSQNAPRRASAAISPPATASATRSPRKAS